MHWQIDIIIHQKIKSELRWKNLASNTLHAQINTNLKRWWRIISLIACKIMRKNKSIITLQKFHKKDDDLRWNPKPPSQ